jgi:hypothetical protein
VTHPFERVGEGFRVHLPREARDALARILPQLREVLEHADRSSDPAVLRLFPAAYPDDPFQNLEFETTAGEELLRGRLDSLRIMESSLDTETLSEHEALSWLASLNGLRLLLGVRLEVTEETTEDDFPAEEGRRLYDLYRYLTWLEGSIVEVLPIR